MKIIKWFLIVSVSILVILFALFKFMQSQTKKASPEQTLVHNIDGTNVSVFYCRPFKKDREIFGALVPYGEVWRTGANEATTFSTDQDITIAGKPLPKGEYTMWTIPGESSWKVIFNSKSYGWGVDFNSKAAREPEFDVLEVEVPVQQLPSVQEQFTITFEETSPMAMTLAWDQTKIALPIN